MNTVHVHVKNKIGRKASRVWSSIGEVFFFISAVFLVSKKIIIPVLKQVSVILRIQKLNSKFCLFFSSD